MTVIPFTGRTGDRPAAPPLVVPEIKAVAAFALRETGRFDTLEIAEALELPEPAVVRMIDIFRRIP